MAEIVGKTADNDADCCSVTTRSIFIWSARILFAQSVPAQFVDLHGDIMRDDRLLLELEFLENIWLQDLLDLFRRRKSQYLRAEQPSRGRGSLFLA